MRVQFTPFWVDVMSSLLPPPSRYELLERQMLVVERPLAVRTRPRRLTNQIQNERIEMRVWNVADEDRLDFVSNFNLRSALYNAVHTKKPTSRISGRPTAVDGGRRESSATLLRRLLMPTSKQSKLPN
jgi:hypothetical protein